MVTMLHYFMQTEMTLKDRQIKAKSSRYKRFIYNLTYKHFINQTKKKYLEFFILPELDSKNVIQVAQFIDYARKMNYIKSTDLSNMIINYSSYENISTASFLLPADIDKDTLYVLHNFVPSLEVKVSVRDSDTLEDDYIHIIRTFKKNINIRENLDTERYEVVSESIHPNSEEDTCTAILVNSAYDFINSLIKMVIELTFDSVTERFKL